MPERNPPFLFVGCSSESLIIAKAIQTNLASHAHVELWNQGTFKPSQIYLDALLDHAKRADFAVFLLTADDVTQSRSFEESSPRDNIIFEAGLFMGILGRSRVFLLAPAEIHVKSPSDLSGMTMLTYWTPPPGGNWRATVGSATNQIEEVIEALASRSNRVVPPSANVSHQQAYASISEASSDIRSACRVAADLKVLSITGSSLIGRDDSVVPLHELTSYANMRKIRVIMMSTHSRWITSGLVARRGRESVDDFVDELHAAHSMVELGLKRVLRTLPDIKSGIRYFTGEPCWRLVMTEHTAFVSNYADDGRIAQARDLPVYRFDNKDGSFYSAFHRHFNDIWHNHCATNFIESPETRLTTSAGGVVYFGDAHTRTVVLLRRFNNEWVLPKGHKVIKDQVLDSTALREVSEESGIPVARLKVEQLLGSYADNSYPDEHKEVFIYAISCDGPERPPLRPDPDHAEARWCTDEEAVELITVAAQKEIMKRFIRMT